MNRDESGHTNHKFNYYFGEQPRKAISRKYKKNTFVKKFEDDVVELDKGRHSYHRASNKSLTRSQVRTGQILF